MQGKTFASFLILEKNGRVNYLVVCVTTAYMAITRGSTLSVIVEVECHSHVCMTVYITIKYSIKITDFVYYTDGYIIIRTYYRVYVINVLCNNYLLSM